MAWLAKLLGFHRPTDDLTGSTADELREAKELRTEQKRHVDAIETHVNRVSARVRADAEAAERRLARR